MKVKLVTTSGFVELEHVAFFQAMGAQLAPAKVDGYRGGTSCHMTHAPTVEINTVEELFALGKRFDSDIAVCFRTNEVEIIDTYRD